MPKEYESIDDAIEKYVEMRNYLRVESAKFNTLEKEVKEELERISMWLRNMGDELGVDGFKTKYGTAFRSVKTKYMMGDWQEFIDWIKETGNYQCLEHRSAKLAVKEIHDVTGEIPPGLNYSAEVEFDVRSPTRSTKD